MLSKRPDGRPRGKPRSLSPARVLLHFSLPRRGIEEFLSRMHQMQRRLRGSQSPGREGIERCSDDDDDDDVEKDHAFLYVKFLARHFSSALSHK